MYLSPLPPEHQGSPIQLAKNVIGKTMGHPYRAGQKETNPVTTAKNPVTVFAGLEAPATSRPGK